MLKLRHTLFLFFFFAIVFARSQAFEKMRNSIDSIVLEAIQSKAFPGCVVLASKNDSVFFIRSYGHHTYDSIRRVAVNDIYDLASITKVIGGTLAMMKLYEDGYYELDDPIGDYIDKLGKLGKVTFREVLSHQAGLYPWIPFYKQAKRRNGKYKGKTISTTPNDDFNYQISDSLYLHEAYYEKIKKMIRGSKLSANKEYRYSGLFFYLIPELVQKFTSTSFEEYLHNNFYNPLNTSTLMYNPLMNFSLRQIVPTEVDTFFRMKPIHGRVHDEGAIMMKGVSANAGLFSNAEDLNKVFQMFLNEGRVDSIRLLSPQTIRLFTTSQYPNNNNRRGLGFDKPLLEYDSIASSVAKSASYSSYGHTGYTGTLAWADPDKDLIFIFLTNRVYPSRNNRALYQLNVRPTIHQLIYDYLKENLTSKKNPVENTK